MRFAPKQVLLLVICIGIQILTSAQDSTVLSNPNFISSYAEQVATKATEVGTKLDRHSQKALKSLARQEAKMKRKLSRIDSLKAAQLFPGKNDFLNKASLSKYNPSLDTMISSLNFLEGSGVSPDKVKAAIAKVNKLKGELGKAENIKQYLKERKEYLKEQLSKFGFARDLKRLNKQAYYYSEQLKEYKALIKDKKKREKKALELLSNSKHFKDFMRKNSQLASLFRLSGSDPTSQASISGLQTRVQVNNLLQQQIAAGGPSGMQQFQQNMQQAQSQLQALKNKIIKQGGGSSDDIMPEGFKPNNQKTKGFWQRLEYGTNIQTTKNNGWFPVTSDLGLSVGYKLNDKSIIGLGGSYKLGWGKNIQNINITHQGVGLRSFVDLKLNGNFWVSGGYEMNYRSVFNRIDQLQDMNAWQQSGLIGLSKTVSVRSKFFKKTKLQLLWDFLSYQQVPITQPVVFRLGYSFK